MGRPTAPPPSSATAGLTPPASVLHEGQQRDRLRGLVVVLGITLGLGFAALLSLGP